MARRGTRVSLACCAPRHAELVTQDGASRGFRRGVHCQHSHSMPCLQQLQAQRLHQAALASTCREKRESSTAQHHVRVRDHCRCHDQQVTWGASDANPECGRVLTLQLVKMAQHFGRLRRVKACGVRCSPGGVQTCCACCGLVDSQSVIALLTDSRSPRATPSASCCA